MIAADVKIPRRVLGLKVKALALLGWVVALGVAEGLLAAGLFTTTTADFERFEAYEEIERDLIVSSIMVGDLLSDTMLPTEVDSSTTLGVLAHWQGDLGSLMAVRDETRERIGQVMDVIRALHDRAENLIYADAITAVAIADLRDALVRDLPVYADALDTNLAALQAEIHHHLDLAAERRIFYGRAMAIVAVFGLLGLAVGGGMFLARMVRAMAQLRYQTERIAAGDFQAQVPVNRSDELGEVIAAVNGMAIGLAARDNELESMRDRFGQQERMFTLGVFAAQMGHELGNPVQAIMAISGHVAETLHQSPDQQTVLECLPLIEVIGQHAERLAGTVRDIREFSRPQRGDHELVDLNELVHNTVRLMRFEPRFHKIQLDLDLASDLPPLTLVTDHIVQVLINLLINASDAVPADAAVIHIATRRAGTGARLLVKDNGPGMEEVVMGRVFDPFFTTKLGENGTGLGLTICKSIIENHGGRIRLQSMLGAGTTVEVFLPQGNT